MLLSFTRNRMEEARKRIYHQIQMKLQDFGGISAVYDRPITMMLSHYKVWNRDWLMMKKEDIKIMVQKQPEMCFSNVELEDPWTRWCAGVLVYKDDKFSWPTSKILTSLCMCVYILPPWRLLPSARCPRHTLGHGSTILC